jgi:hypothetical protein
MAQNKTQKTTKSVTAFVKSVESSSRSDCKTIIKMMRKATGAKPAMWGESIIGFGDTHLKYASGRELDWFKIGFSPRKKEISLYLTCQSKNFGNFLKKLGSHRTGKGCLYIKSLQDINIEVLQEIFETGAQT